MTVPEILAKVTRQLTEAMPRVLATARSDFREMGMTAEEIEFCVYQHELDVFEKVLTTALGMLREMSTGVSQDDADAIVRRLH